MPRLQGWNVSAPNSVGVCISAENEAGVAKRIILTIDNSRNHGIGI